MSEMRQALLLLLAMPFLLMCSGADSKTVSNSVSVNDTERSSAKTICNNEDGDIVVNEWTVPLLEVGNKKFYLGTFFRANWFGALQYCRYHGMDLASITSQHENDIILRYIQETGYLRNDFWLSGSDLAENGKYFWAATGRPLTFADWSPGQPDHSVREQGEIEHCLEFWYRDSTGLKWNDDRCSAQNYFICEVRETY